MQSVFEVGAVPPLEQLYVYLTEGCNLACSHCWISPIHDTAGTVARSLPLAVFENIIREALPLGLHSVKLTGGEPLLHPRFAEILAVIRREGLSLTIETNGVLCTDEVAEAVTRCEKPFVAVSLDGAVAHTHEGIRGVAGCFERARSGIRSLVGAGLHPQIIMTLQRSNAAEAEALIGLARDLGVASVKFNVVQPAARGARLHEKGATLGVEELIALGRRLEENEAARASGVQVLFDYPSAFRSLKRITANGCASCSILNILGVLPTGEYALCGIGKIVPELVFGTAGDDGLVDVWSSHPTLRELRAGLPTRLGGVCGRCLMRGSCVGACLAQNFLHNGSFWEPYWFCAEAERAGLFPPSRLGAPARCAESTVR